MLRMNTKNAKKQSSFSRLIASITACTSTQDSESILDCAFHGNIPIARKNVKMSEMQDALIKSAAEGDFDEVKCLVEHKVQINTADYDSRTALHVSAAYGHIKIVTYLIANKADICYKDRWGRSALADAIEEGHRTVEKVLRHAMLEQKHIQENIYCPGCITVLLVDIKNFTSSCSSLSAREVCAWISTFYALVDQAALPLGVRKAEIRGDCCICVAGDLSVAPCKRLLSPASKDDQVTRMLRFAEILQPSLLGAKPSISVRMGIAYGEAAFLIDDYFISVQGKVVNTAARMETHAPQGTVMVHQSALHKWADEMSTHTLPRCNLLDCKGMPPQAAAIFDCMKGTFIAAAQVNKETTANQRRRIQASFSCCWDI